MALVELEIPLDIEPPPADVCRFLRDADDRIDVFQTDCRVPGFVPSDYQSGYRVLRAITETNHLRGRQFCEWGSGFGVITCLAAMLDLEACGIEIERLLVDQARQLADDFGVAAEFSVGSFVPPGAEDRVHAGGNYAWMTTEGDQAYEELGLEPGDMDIIFAYPWPDEEGIVSDLFDRYAGAGALLVTYHGGDDFRLRRKKEKRSSRRGR